MSLTDRQLQIARLVAKGYTNKAIARETGLAIQTVKNHISNAAERIPGDGSIRIRLVVFLLTEHDQAA